MKEAKRVTGENRSERRNSKTINKLIYDIHQNVSIKKVKKYPTKDNGHY